MDSIGNTKLGSGRESDGTRKPGIVKTSRTGALRVGLVALGFRRDLGSTCERRERYLATDGTASDAFALGRFSAVYLGPAGSLRVGSSLRTSYDATGSRLDRDAIAAARVAGFVVRERRASTPRPARPQVDWIARAGITGVGSVDNSMAREIARQTVLYAAGRAICCHGCGAILDAPRTWVEDSGKVLCDNCHHSEPLDLGHPSGLAGIAPEDFD